MNFWRENSNDRNVPSYDTRYFFYVVLEIFFCDFQTVRWGDIIWYNKRCLIIHDTDLYLKYFVLRHFRASFSTRYYNNLSTLPASLSSCFPVRYIPHCLKITTKRYHFITFPIKYFWTFAPKNLGNFCCKTSITNLIVGLWGGVNLELSIN